MDSENFFKLFSDLAPVVSAVASVVTAIGVLYAARQALATLSQLAHAKESQAISVHCAFQREFREWQKKLPAEAAEPSWQANLPGERRLIQLYWELVFDEWYSCKKLSDERKINSLWSSYAKGVQGAMVYDSFIDVLRETFQRPTFYLGHAKEFRAELRQVFNAQFPHLADEPSRF